VDTSASPKTILDYIIKIVPPNFFSTTNRKVLEPSFYMFYHELGYYEYSISPFKNYLKQANYSNSYFTPKGFPIQLDDTYQKSLDAFLKTPKAETIFFIYGQYDPWALQTEAKKNVFTVRAGSHKSRIANLTKEQREFLDNKIKILLN
ncbi:MAG: hypothetical protein ACXVPU_17340, partial [Bacteroidia bacterium]